MYPECLKNLIECLKDFPGVGDKSAERMAFAIMNFDKERITFFSDSLIAVRDNIRRCSVCNNITDKEVCSICSNDARKKDVIFVVEKPKDVILFEKINYFNGVYHVLDGLISPLEGINPEDINIKRLIERIDEDNVKEVILALKPSIEGETTMQYIRKLLENKNVKVTKIAIVILIVTVMVYIN